MTMNYGREYARKLVSADEAVRSIASGDVVDYGFFNGKPVDCDIALARRAGELQDVSVYTAVTVPPVPEVAKHPESFIYIDWHWSKLTRLLQLEYQPYYSPIMYQRAAYYMRNIDEPREYRSRYYDSAEKLKGGRAKWVSICQVTPMNESGYFNIGPQNSATSATIENADLVIVEVNRNQPVCLGGSEEAIHVSRVDHVVEQAEDRPLFDAPPAKPSRVDALIAGHMMNYIRDGSCIQLGIGGMPNAVGHLIAESDLRDLGGHTEMFVDAYVEMIESGRMNGSRKSIDRYRCAYTFSIGSRRMYEFMDNNPAVASYPVEYTNDPAVIARLDNFVSINNAVSIDLFSQVNAESVVYDDGTPGQISGNGGMLDFIMGSQWAKNGKSFICLASTYTDTAGRVQSRIVPTLEPGTIVTIPRQMVDYVATEWGVARLTACPAWMRAEKLIGIAHPDFREGLIQEAERMRIWRRSNKR